MCTSISKVNEQKIFLTCALSLFKLFEKAVVLNEIMRQQGDDQKEFRGLLTSIAKGTFGKVEWEKLKQRDLDGPNFTPNEREQFKMSAIMVCAYNKDLNEHNITRIKAIGKPIAVVKAHHICTQAANTSLSSNQDGGLPKNLILCKGMEVMLVSTNLWSEAGLTNGARGTVRFFLYKSGEKPPAIPQAVVVHFPQYRGGLLFWRMSLNVFQ